MRFRNLILNRFNQNPKARLATNNQYDARPNKSPSHLLSTENPSSLSWTSPPLLTKKNKSSVPLCSEISINKDDGKDSALTLFLYFLRYVMKKLNQVCTDCALVCSVTRLSQRPTAERSASTSSKVCNLIYWVMVDARSSELSRVVHKVWIFRIMR